MKDELLYNLVPLFKKLAVFGNNAIISHYKIENKEFTSSIRAYKEGVIKRSDIFKHKGLTIEYGFHGTGCTLKIDGIIINFNYSFKDDGIIHFGCDSYKSFVETYQKFIEKEYNSLPNIHKLLNNCTILSGDAYYTI